MGTSRSGWRAGAASVLMLSAAVLCADAQTASRTNYLSLARECPTLEGPLCGTVERDAQPTQSGAELASAIPSRDLIRRLPMSDAVAMLERAVATHVAVAADVIDGFQENRNFSMDPRKEDYDARVQAALSRAEAAAASLSREEAARLTWAVMNARIARGRSNDLQRARLDFIKQFSRTATAELIEVDILAIPASTAAIDNLEAYAAAHPKSVAGAKALYQAAFHVAANLGIGYRLPAGTDPTPYVLRRMKFVDMLEHGGFPKCEWTSRAVEVATSLYEVSQRDGKHPAYAPGSVEKLIAVYQDFAAAHFDDDERSDALQSSIGRLITTYMGPWHELIGVRDGVDRVLAYVEAHGASPTNVALFRAQYLASRVAAANSVNEAAMSEARAALQALVDANLGYPSRKALVTMMDMAGYAGRDNDIVADTGHYLSLYSDSPWAWGASLRLGQARERLGDKSGAAADYERAAAPTSPATVRTIALALLARIHESADRFQLALDTYREANAVWSSSMPDSIDTRAPAPWTVRPVGAAVERASISRADLRARIAALDRYANVKNGEWLQRADRDFNRGEFAAARAAALQFLQLQSDAADVKTARELQHAAELEMALAIGVKNAADPAFANAMATLAAEPIDGAVAAARIAHALILARSSDASVGQSLLLKTLSDWRDATRLPQVVDAALERDLASVINTSLTYVFEQQDSSSYGKRILPLPGNTIAVMQSSVRLTLADTPTSMHIIAALPDMRSKALVVSDRDVAWISRAAMLAGGRQPSKTIGDLWTSVFPSSAGAWNGWAIESYPAVWSVTFDDEARTRAFASVRLDRESGYTAVLEKTGDRWTVIRVTNRWIS